MRTLASIAIASTCLLLGASCATTDDPRSANAARGEQCFNARNAHSFRPVGNDAVDVELSRNRVHRLSIAGCFNVDWANRVALRSRSGSFICSAGDAELIVPSPIGPDRCQVTAIRRLSEAEIAARPRY